MRLALRRRRLLAPQRLRLRHRLPGGADHTFHDVKWSTSPVLGARAGYWLEGAPWSGVGLDLFRFRADISEHAATLRSIDISITVAAFDVLRLRYRREGSALRPYFSAGPALFYTRAQNRGNGELTSRRRIPLHALSQRAGLRGRDHRAGGADAARPRHASPACGSVTSILKRAGLAGRAPPGCRKDPRRGSACRPRR